MRLHPLNTPIGRFRVQTLEEGADRCAATMPAHGLLNPVTGAPSLAALAVLLDHVGGLINHHRRGDHEWTVSSELSLDLAPDATSLIACHPDTPVLATSRPLGAKGATALGELLHGGIASAGLELVASAAVNAGRADDPLTTASLRVNFLRQFVSGDQSRYVGTALRVGRRTGVADSQAIGADGKVAIMARTTAYRC